eukprot:m.18241 g.18241  ORF g.18241 m.18241 type:complete len:254 (+) comp10777_c0_seq1:86-847(+)
MPSKHKLKFRLELRVEQLLSVPYKTGVLFCKIKRKEGTLRTDRVHVANHAVQWGKTVTFPVKMQLGESGVVESSILKIAVRREQQGSASPLKAGVANVDLSEFAGRQGVQRRYLLDPETKDSRQDNSVLTIVVSMTLISGPPVFKARPYTEAFPQDDEIDGVDLSQALDRLKIRDSQASMQPGHHSWNRSDAGAVVDEILRTAGSHPSGSMASLPSALASADDNDTLPTRSSHLRQGGARISKSEGHASKSKQ